MSLDRLEGICRNQQFSSHCSTADQSGKRTATKRRSTRRDKSNCLLQLQSRRTASVENRCVDSVENRLTAHNPFPQRWIQSVFQPRSFRYSDEALPTKSSEGEEVLQDMLYSRLIERALVKQSRYPGFRNFDDLRFERDCGVEEHEEKRIQDTMS